MSTAAGKKIAIVTGSALGLGYELARQLIGKGWFVAGIDFNTARQEELLINNAGQPSFKKPVDYEAADVDKCLKGLKGMILWSVETLKADGEQDLKIANVMSTAATRGNANESVYCATKWGEKGYTTSLKAAYKGTSVKVVGVYPGGIDTDFYHDSHDYVSLDKQHSFMSAAELAEVVLFNLVNDANLTVSDILIERNYR